MIEPLESRIAPATLILGGKGVSFTDTDGDAVTIKTTRGAFDIGNNITFTGGAGHERIYFINCDGTFSGANLTVTVKKVPGGDGKTNVTAIAAQNVNLGAVTIPGDLEAINCGTNDATIPALKSLKIGSFGTVQSLLGVQQSTINGKFGSISVAGNFETEQFEVTGNKSGSVTIGGDVRGDEQGLRNDSGVVRFDGSITSLTIKGDVVGGGGLRSGCVFVQGASSVKVSEGLFRAGLDSGRLTVGDVGSLTIGSDILGEVIANGKVGSVTVDGQIGAGGRFEGNFPINSMLVKKSILKTDPTIIPLILKSVGSLTINGDLRRDFAGAGDPLVLSVSETIKTLAVKGNIGNDDPAKPTTLTVSGNGPSSTVKAVGGVSVGGNVSNTFFDFLNGGAPATSLPVVGKITVGRDWTSSTLSAGTTLQKNPPTLAAPYNVVKGSTGVSIDSIAIKGNFKVNANGILSAIGADNLKTLTIKGKKAALTPGVDETLVITDGIITDLMLVYKVV